jgi:hypothetical protein
MPATSGAARIGPPLPKEHPGLSVACLSSCTLAQVRLGGDPMKAPITGTISHFRIQEPNGTYRLQVLHKRENGSYKAVRQSPAFTNTSERPVKSFPVSLSIRKGNFIGVRMPADTPLSTVAKSHSVWDGFFPAIAVGTSAQPGDSNPDGLLLYNATVRR